jgi:serine/threonine-protein kinase HipA
MQTADISGIGTSAMRAIFEDIEANAARQAEAVLASLPENFPEQLVASTMEAFSHRTRLVADSLANGHV